MTSNTLTVESQTASARRTLWPLALAVFAASFAWFLVGTAGLPLIDRDEPMIAEVARQMVQRGEWLQPHLPAWEYKSIFKPPMAMWAIALSFKVFGVSELTARLPSVICSALTVALLFAAAGRRWGRSAGLVAAACMALPLLPALTGRMALTDPLLVLLATVILLCLERSLRTGGSTPLNLLMWITVGLTFLVKGPAVLVFLGPALVLTVDRPRWRPYLVFLAGMLLVVLPGYVPLPGILVLVVRILGGLIVLGSVLRWLVPVLRLPIGLAWGVPLAGLVGGWWFVYIAYASATHQQSLERYVGFEVLTRIVAPIESHWGPPGYYVLVLLAGLLPFSILLPRLLGDSFRNRQADSVTQLLLGWSVGSWLLWEVVVTKLPHYILPAIPALALLAASWYSRQIDRHRGWPRLAAIWGLALLVALLLASRLTSARANLSHRCAQQAMELAANGERFYAFGYTEPGVFFYLPADRYQRVPDRQSLQDLRSMPGPFVLIVGAKQQAEAERLFASRITASRKAEGYNAAKARWATAVIFRVAAAVSQPTGAAQPAQTETPAAASQPTGVR